MLLRILTLSALAVRSASAFRDASPFFLLSTSELSGLGPELSRGDRIATADTIAKDISASLAHGCPSDSYIIVNQAGVSAADFVVQGSTPHMTRRLSGKDKSLKTISTISNVIGSQTDGILQQTLSSRCGAKLVTLDGSELPAKSASTPQVITINFSRTLSTTSERAATLSQNDAYLNEVITSLPSEKYTVIYRTTPPAPEHYQQYEHSEQLYEMDEPYPTGLHIDLKRELEAYPSATNGSNLDYDIGLFEKYQFLSSGIFMGGLVSLLLFFILYVGVSAISGLEVSYMAFSKEMNPANQKKQQ